MRKLLKEAYAVKQHIRHACEGMRAAAWGAGFRGVGCRRRGNMAKRMRARRRMPWGAGAKKAVASHERPGGAADAL